MKQEEGLQQNPAADTPAGRRQSLLKKVKERIDWRLFAVLMTAAMVSTALGQPYLRSITAQPMTAGWMLTALLINGAGSLLGIFVGLLAGPFVGLKTPVLSAWVHGRKQDVRRLWGITLLAFLLGLAVPLLTLGVDYLLGTVLAGQPADAAAAEGAGGVQLPSLFVSLIACFYGGVFEEITLRLFIMTFYVWLFSWIVSRIRKEAIRGYRAAIIAGIILSATIFGLAHVLTLMQITTPEPLLIVRVIAGNALPGLVFGWLFWRFGLFSAMVAHFTGDLVLHVVVPFLSGAW